MQGVGRPATMPTFWYFLRGWSKSEGEPVLVTLLFLLASIFGA